MVSLSFSGKRRAWDLLVIRMSLCPKSSELVLSGSLDRGTAVFGRSNSEMRLELTAEVHMAVVAALQRNIGDAPARPQEKPCYLRGAQAPHVGADRGAEVA